MTWRIVFTRQARKDAKKLDSSGLRPAATRILELLAEDPWRTPPPCERLLGDYRGFVSRRINVQHRIVYQVIEDERTIRIVRMWTHYE